MQGSWARFPVQTYIFICISLYLCNPPIPTTFDAVAFPVQAFVFNKSRQGGFVFVVCVFEGEDFVRGGGEECDSSG